MHNENETFIGHTEYEYVDFSADTRFPKGRILTVQASLAERLPKTRMPYEAIDTNLVGEYFGEDETRDLLSNTGLYAQGKIRFKKFVDKEGELKHWNLHILPQLNKSTKLFMEEVIKSQQSNNERNKIKSLLNDAMPYCEVNPENGVTMYFPQKIKLKL